MYSRLGYLFFILSLYLLSGVCQAQKTAIYKYGIYNRKGKEILPFVYDAVQLSNDGKYLILKKGDELVYLNGEGKSVPTPTVDSSSFQQSRYQEIPPPNSKYDLALCYRNGFVKVRHAKTKKGGILNPKGKEIVKSKYDWFYLDILNNGLIKGKEGNNYHLFNAKGKELGLFDDIGQSFNDGRLLIVKDDLFGYVDKTGTIILPAIYQRARAFSNQYAFVIQNDTAFYINPSGEKSIELPFGIHDGQTFQENLVVVKDKNGNHSLVNSKSEVLFKLPLSHLDNFQNGISAAKKSFKGDTWGIIDEQGNEVIPFQYHETKVYTVNGKSLIAIRKAATQDNQVVEDSNKKPSLTSKAYCYTAILQYPEINALGATQLSLQALFIELYAPHRMPADEVKRRGKEIALKKYPQSTVSQEFFTEVKNCLEIRNKLATQIKVDKSELIEEHITP